MTSMNQTWWDGTLLKILPILWIFSFHVQATLKSGFSHHWWVFSLGVDISAYPLHIHHCMCSSSNCSSVTTPCQMLLTLRLATACGAALAAAVQWNNKQFLASWAGLLPSKSLKNAWAAWGLTGLAGLGGMGGLCAAVGALAGCRS